MIALNAHFDGKVIVPDEPLDLPPNQRVRIQIEPVPSGATVEAISTSTTSKLQLGLQPDAFPYVAPDFDSELGDEFWLGEDK